MNDLRPIALTSVAMKVFAKILLNQLKPLVTKFVDPLQFAYISNRSTEDAVAYKLEKLYSHLEGSRNGNSVRIMYYDFSSAFNTMQPHLLTRKLLNMDVPHQLVKLMLDFLTNRSQFVKLNGNVQSESLITNTGAPQGTVLAPFLFTVYTSDFRSCRTDSPVIKFADDTA